MKSIIFIILSISGIYAQHSITEEYILNDCLKKFPAELEKCATDAFLALEYRIDSYKRTSTRTGCLLY